MRICSISNCKNKHLSRGYCQKHYLRWYRYGDVTICKKPSEFVPRGKESASYKHGNWDHPLYKTWRNMISRCMNSQDRAYKHYGKRGIIVCERWLDLNNFIKDMWPKPKPKGTSLDRIDNNGNYEPSNCRWTDNKTQGRNRRCVKLTKEKAEEIRNLKKNGYTKPRLAKEYNVSVATIKKVVSNAYWN